MQHSKGSLSTKYIGFIDRDGVWIILKYGQIQRQRESKLELCPQLNTVVVESKK